MFFTDKTHFFRDEQDNRTAVITTMVDSNCFEAVIIEGEHAELSLRGEGESRFAAIADLNEKIVKARADVDEEGSEVPGFDDATRNDEYFR